MCERKQKKLIKYLEQMKRNLIGKTIDKNSIITNIAMIIILLIYK